MSAVASPPKRIPLNLPSIPPSDEDPVANELNAVCRREQKQYSLNGCLTPRKNDRSMEQEQEQAYRHWRDRFQPAMRDTTQEEQQKTADVEGGVVKTPQWRGTDKRQLLALRRLFDELRETDIDPATQPGLLLLSLAAREDNGTISWTPVTQTERNIRARIDRMTTDETERRARAKKLMEEQAVKVTERELFLKQTAQSRLDAKVSADADTAALERMDKLAAQDEESKRTQEAQRVQLGEERKQAAREAYLQRKQQRQEKLREILDMEENTIDDYEAVCRVRAQLEKEKGPQAADPSPHSPPAAAPHAPPAHSSPAHSKPAPAEKQDVAAAEEDRELTPVEDDPLEEL